MDKRLQPKETFINESQEFEHPFLYRGVVEDNNDPDKIQRVKVRIYGIHTENNENSAETFEIVKTTDLPWAEVVGSTAFGLVSGVGITSVLRQGTWVWVILEKNDPNKPIVLGTIPGINSSSSAGKYASGIGFCDPDGIYPTSEGSSRTDINVLADTNYPDISVIETGSGHKIILDDTQDDETIQIEHKSGTYINIDKDGNLNIDITGDEIKTLSGNATLTVNSGQTISIGNGTDELLDLFDQMLTEYKKLVSATMLNGNVDLAGAASSGTNQLITSDLTSMESTIDNIKNSLSNIKV